MNFRTLSLLYIYIDFKNILHIQILKTIVEIFEYAKLYSNFLFVIENKENRICLYDSFERLSNVYYRISRRSQRLRGSDIDLWRRFRKSDGSVRMQRTAHG